MPMLLAIPTRCIAIKSFDKKKAKPLGLNMSCRSNYLKTFLNENVIDQDTFELFLDNFVQNIKLSYPLHQKVIVSNIKQMTTHAELQKFSFQNKISNRRIVDIKDTNLTTYAYGYQK